MEACNASWLQKRRNIRSYLLQYFHRYSPGNRPGKLTWHYMIRSVWMHSRLWKDERHGQNSHPVHHASTTGILNQMIAIYAISPAVQIGTSMIRLHDRQEGTWADWWQSWPKQFRKQSRSGIDQSTEERIEELLVCSEVKQQLAIHFWRSLPHFCSQCTFSPPSKLTAVLKYAKHCQYHKRVEILDGFHD